MIKAIAIALPVVIVLNLLAGLGFVGWMYQSGRLNTDRIHRVVDMFKPTIAQEETMKAQAQAQADADAEQAKVNARIANIEAGGQTLSQLFERDLVREESGQQVAARVSQEAEQLRAQMRNFQTIIDQQQAALNADRASFVQEVERQKQRVKDEDFQQAVKLMEALEAKAMKGVFDNLIQQGKLEQVVDYLAAMNARKASGVLSEYKGPQEAATLTQLLVKLDHRRSAPLQALTLNNADPSADPAGGTP